MSYAPRLTCTECHLVARTSDVRSFSTCPKHRLCKGCLASRGGRSQAAIAKDQCPVCDESRRRLGTQVRSRIWSEENMKLECVSCSSYRPGGALMMCGHSYCLPCLRMQPRSAQTRTVQGNMARGCHFCEKAATEELREDARAAMERAERVAQDRRDQRETREFREDRGMALPAQNRPKKRAAPKGHLEPPQRALTVPVGPSFLEKDSDGDLKVTKSVWRKVPKPSGRKNLAPKPSSSGASADKANRRVSFDPNVQHHVISPRQATAEVNKRFSLESKMSYAQDPFKLEPRPIVGVHCTAPEAYALMGSGLHLNTNLTNLVSGQLKKLELRGPTADDRRNFTRGWGVTSP